MGLNTGPAGSTTLEGLLVRMDGRLTTCYTRLSALVYARVAVAWTQSGLTGPPPLPWACTKPDVNWVQAERAKTQLVPMD